MKTLHKVGSALALAALPVLAFGAPPDPYETITSAVDFADAAAAIGAIAALLAVVLVVRKGVRFVLGMIR